MSLAHADLAPRSKSDADAMPWRLRIEEGRALIRLATPITLIALVNMGMSVTDTLMVSALFGTGALAAVAVGSDFYSIVFYLSAGVLGGIAPFYTAAVTRADGNERARLKRIGWAMVGLLAALTVPRSGSRPSGWSASVLRQACSNKARVTRAPWR
jgi:multidrug resistance protein, MATE family